MPKIELEGEGWLLALASVDMRQAAAAARLLEAQGQLHERRALETAIAVCYARPFVSTNRPRALGKKWWPEGEADRALHHDLMGLRNHVYAHVDAAGGRKASVEVTFDADGFVERLSVGEWWEPLDRGLLRSIITLCDVQRRRFLSAAEDAALEAIGELR